MKVKVFYPNSKGEITFTKDELEKLLDEVYDAGYQDGKKSSWTWTSPYTWTTTTGTPYNGSITTATSSASGSPLEIHYGADARISLNDDQVCINNTETGTSFTLNDYVQNCVKDQKR